MKQTILLVALATVSIFDNFAHAQEIPQDCQRLIDASAACERNVDALLDAKPVPDAKSIKQDFHQASTALKRNVKAALAKGSDDAAMRCRATSKELVTSYLREVWKLEAVDSNLNLTECKDGIAKIEN